MAMQVDLFITFDCKLLVLIEPDREGIGRNLTKYTNCGVSGILNGLFRHQ